MCNKVKHENFTMSAPALVRAHIVSKDDYIIFCEFDGKFRRNALLHLKRTNTQLLIGGHGRCLIAYFRRPWKADHECRYSSACGATR